MKLRGANILVTGGAKRVGRIIALTLAAQGANILLHYRSSTKEARDLCEQIRDYPVQAKAFKADLRKLFQVRRMVRQAWKAFGGIDVLVNSASVFFRTPIETLTEKEWDLTLDTNLKGNFFLAREVGLLMAERGSGKIINIADWAGARPYKNYLPYCISKAGVLAMTKGLARTFAPAVSVNAISPGPILLPPDLGPEDKEKIIHGTPLHRIGSPDDIAAAVKILIEGTDFMTGSILTVDGGRLIA